MSGKLVATVQGSAATPYEIRETADPNVLWCSCPAWRNNKATPKTGKHIKAHQGGAPLAPPVGRPTAATSTSPGKPMRLESVDPKDAHALIESDEWVVEQKVDGTRVVITVTGSAVAFTASNGEPLKHSASLLHAKALTAALPDGHYVLDGELLWTGEFYAFDAPDHDGPLAQRRARLESLFATEAFGAPIRLLPQARTVTEKVALLRRVHDAGGEGIVIKHAGKPYEYGRRVVHQLKLKFTKTVDCVVTDRNVAGKENAVLAAHDADGQLVNIGSCSMLGKPDAQPGDVVEVRYLYASEDLRLYQPTLLRVRTDKAAADCSVAQLTPVDKTVSWLRQTYTDRSRPPSIRARSLAAESSASTVPQSPAA